MNIQGSKPPESREIKRPEAERPAEAGPKERTAQGQASPEDRIKLSSAPREVSVLMAAVAKLPDVREEKVRQLQEEIQSGNYKPDVRKIAARMLEEL